MTLTYQVGSLLHCMLGICGVGYAAHLQAGRQRSVVTGAVQNRQLVSAQAAHLDHDLLLRLLAAAAGERLPCLVATVSRL